MKKFTFLAVGFALIIFSCTKKQEIKSPVEGVWNMVGFTWISGDTITNYRILVLSSEARLRYGLRITGLLPGV